MDYVIKFMFYVIVVIGITTPVAGVVAYNMEGKKVSFKDYMSFRIFQTVSENVKEYMPADYQFYKNKEYYQPAQIGIFTKILTVIMLQLVFFLMRDMGPGEEKNR